MKLNPLNVRHEKTSIVETLETGQLLEKSELNLLDTSLPLLECLDTVKTLFMDHCHEGSVTEFQSVVEISTSTWTTSVWMSETQEFGLMREEQKINGEIDEHRVTLEC